MEVAVLITAGSVETMLAQIKGIKIVYPSNAADFKGLFKLLYRPNPVIFLEHKVFIGVKFRNRRGKTVEPAEDYILPFGKANIVKFAMKKKSERPNSSCRYLWNGRLLGKKIPAKNFEGRIEIIDLEPSNR